MCMRQALDQTVVPVPSFGWSCDIRVAQRHAAPLRVHLATVNVDSNGCWRPEAVKVAGRQAASVEIKLRSVTGCVP